jgi:hypothetical protein
MESKKNCTTQGNKPVLINNKACNLMANYAIAVISLQLFNLLSKKILFLSLKRPFPLKLLNSQAFAQKWGNCRCEIKKR